MQSNRSILTGREYNGQERISNFELLRILTMLFIIAHHYVVNSGITEKITSVNAVV